MSPYRTIPSLKDELKAIVRKRVEDDIERLPEIVRTICIMAAKRGLDEVRFDYQTLSENRINDSVDYDHLELVIKKLGLDFDRFDTYIKIRW